MKKSGIIILTILATISGYNCKKPSLGMDVKLKIPTIPYNYNEVNTPNGSKIILYKDNSTIDNYKATIGRVLFYDKALSINNTTACASCHLQENAFSDPNAFSKGFEGELTLRNTIGINNLIDEAGIGFFWDAREEEIENMVFMPISSHIEMGFERIDLISEKISNLAYYKKLFKDCYGDENVTPKRLRESLGHFLFSIVSFNSKFERSIQNPSIFSKEEIHGKEIFIEKRCNICHFVAIQIPSSYGNTGNNGSTGSSLKFANNGLDEIDIDKGINGEYKIPRLKNISKTAPYMHDGRFKTLEEVIDHYSKNIKNNPNLSSILRDFNHEPIRFNFSIQEKADLIVFLKTLDDEVMPQDLKFSSPFD